MRVVLQSIVRNMVANLSWEMDAHLLYISALPSWEKQSALDRGGEGGEKGFGGRKIHYLQEVQPL